MFFVCYIFSKSPWKPPKTPFSYNLNIRRAVWLWLWKFSNINIKSFIERHINNKSYNTKNDTVQTYINTCISSSHTHKLTKGFWATCICWLPNKIEIVCPINSRWSGTKLCIYLLCILHIQTYIYMYIWSKVW